MAPQQGEHRTQHSHLDSYSCHGVLPVYRRAHAEEWFNEPVSHKPWRRFGVFQGDRRIFVVH